MPRADQRAGHAAARTARAGRRRPVRRPAGRTGRPVCLERRLHRLTGDFPDPDRVGPEQVVSSLDAEPVHPAAEVLLARADGRLVGVAVTLTEHPDILDPYPWIGPLMVHGERYRGGYGRAPAGLVEERLRGTTGADGVRLAVLENDPGALLFRTALGYRAIDRRPDLQTGRVSIVLHKELPPAEGTEGTGRTRGPEGSDGTDRTITR